MHWQAPSLGCSAWPRCFRIGSILLCRYPIDFVLSDEHCILGAYRYDERSPGYIALARCGVLADTRNLPSTRPQRLQTPSAQTPMPTAVIRYHIPDTLSSCLKANRTRNSSRHYDAVNGAFTDWINDCSLFTKPQRKAIKDAQIPLLLAHALPCATEAQLRTCVDLTCVTVILDDLT